MPSFLLFLVCLRVNFFPTRAVWETLSRCGWSFFLGPYCLFDFFPFRTKFRQVLSCSWSPPQRYLGRPFAFFCLRSPRVPHVTLTSSGVLITRKVTLLQSRDSGLSSKFAPSVPTPFQLVQVFFLTSPVRVSQTCFFFSGFILFPSTSSFVFFFPCLGGVLFLHTRFFG